MDAAAAARLAEAFARGVGQGCCGCGGAEWVSLCRGVRLVARLRGALRGGAVRARAGTTGEERRPLLSPTFGADRRRTRHAGLTAPMIAGADT